MDYTDPIKEEVFSHWKLPPSYHHFVHLPVAEQLRELLSGDPFAEVMTLPLGE